MAEFLYGQIQRLPLELKAAADAKALEINPANLAVSGGGDASRLLVADVFRYWGSGGVQLSVGFLENISATLRARILGCMNEWAEFCNVQFVESSPQDSLVRITFKGTRLSSALGIEILFIDKTQPTMHLGGINDNTPEWVLRDHVCHETGHTLGFPHEHLRPEIVSRIDPEKAIAFFMRTQGWSREEVIFNVLTPLSSSQHIFSKSPDEHSIMCYPLPSEIMKDGKAVPGGQVIDDQDREFARFVYPFFTVWHTLRHTDGTWTGLGSLRNEISIASPLASVAGTAGANREAHFIFTTEDGHLWHTLRMANGKWSGSGDLHRQIAVASKVSAVGAANGGNGETQFVFTTDDGHLWHTLRHANGSWTGLGDLHSQIGVPGEVVAVCGAAGIGGEAQFAFTTKDGHVWHTLRHRDGSWTGLGDLTAAIAIPGPVAALAGAGGQDGTAQFAFLTNDGHLWHTLRRSNGSWTGIGDLQK